MCQCTHDIDYINSISEGTDISSCHMIPVLECCAWLCRESLQDIEVRLLAAEEAARQAKDAVQGQADIAKVERERALAARAEAEQANKNLDSARSNSI